jgi:hypothetical protein
MRILTVRQPWAWAIIHGGKDVENRVRNIAGDYRGPVTIHAGLRDDPNGWDEYEAGWHDAASMSIARGAIIGVVDLVDVHSVESCIEQQRDGDWLVCSERAERAGHHLVLANPRPLARPIPFKGALGLRRLDPATIHQIEEQLV